MGLYDLTCEHLSNPEGVATTTPRFGWKISSGVNGECQTAYRILAATSPTLLKEGEADMWDSGVKQSHETTHISYTGKVPQSGQPVYWKVKIWGIKGQESAWSETARFSIGLLEPEDWRGSYIGFPVDAGSPVSPLLRQQFTVNSLPMEAFLHINSLGYHEVYINGNKVGNEVLSPAVSQFNKRSLARTYDVADYLVKGSNDIVIWLSRGWYQPSLPGVVYDGPVVRAQIETWRNGERSYEIYTDNQWKTCESGYTLTSRRWSYSHFGGEKVDANIAPKNFSSAELGKRQWVTAAVVEVPEHTISPQMCEGNIFAETYKAKNIKQLSDSAFLVDIGTTLTGMTEIIFPQLSHNQEIRLDYCDHLENGEFITYQGQTDYYIASGEKNEVFRNRFNYHSFRYIKISGLTVAPALENITANLVRTNYKNASTFECSDSDLNAIHDMIVHTLHCLSLGGYIVDCQHFERLGYGGDGHASTVT
ncbi:MAG: family 78 glycoside hydrolase catalytic domain, partial [Tannerella sp.]|nr:family 78 glycoside hydrolase catalytic domain [Tannerella sp.]